MIHLFGLLHTQTFVFPALLLATDPRSRGKAIVLLVYNDTFNVGLLICSYYSVIYKHP